MKMNEKTKKVVKHTPNESYKYVLCYTYSMVFFLFFLKKEKRNETKHFNVFDSGRRQKIFTWFCLNKKRMMREREREKQSFLFFHFLFQLFCLFAHFHHSSSLYVCLLLLLLSFSYTTFAFTAATANSTTFQLLHIGLHYTLTRSVFTIYPSLFDILFENFCKHIFFFFLLSSFRSIHFIAFYYR